MTALQKASPTYSSPTKNSVPMSKAEALEVLFGSVWNGVKSALNRATFVTGLGALGLGAVLFLDPTLNSLAIRLLALGAGATLARVGMYVEKRMNVVETRISIQAQDLRRLRYGGHGGVLALPESESNSIRQESRSPRLRERDVTHRFDDD